VSSSAEAIVERTHDPRDRRLRMTAWAVFAVTMVEAAGGLGLDGITGRLGPDLWLLPFLAYPIAGVILATRRPRNALGWLMLFAGLGFAVPGESWAHYAVEAHGGNLPGVAIGLGLASPMWVPFIGLSGFMLMVFPDGHLPSPRWRWFARVCGVGLGALFAYMLFVPGTFGDVGFPRIRNPFGIPALDPVAGPLLVLVLFAPLAVVGGAVGVIARLRRTTDPIQREQLRWIAWAAGVIAFAYLVAFIPGVFGLDPETQWSSWLGSAAVMTFMLIPITIGIAVLRYRLFDIDVVIRKTVVYVILAVLILAVGVALVWILSGVFASTFEGGRVDLIAGIVIGLLFWPLRRVATRIADRVVFGGRATPYEVLTEFGDRLAGTYAADDVLERTAKVLGEGLGAERARVWLVEGGELRAVAAWTRSARDGDPHGEPGDDLRVDVRHQGELLGALSVAMPANDPMDPSKEKLVNDLARQAGLLLRNVRLVEDLRASRRRLVAAQDQERRRLERNIHDGAQQQLVALTVKARLARRLSGSEPATTAEMLEQIESETQAALEDLRDLARGIYPPLLADKGLVAAIESQARRSPVPVSVSADRLGRFGSDVEAAAYFSVLESLQNAAKYANASRVTVSLGVADEDLVFEVRDEGRGFDPEATAYGTGLQGIADRLGALDGSLTVRSAPGSGTTIAGRLPAGRSRSGVPETVSDDAADLALVREPAR
jgi:signal transduction histidine kinase